jgi:hypothetical protein
LLPFSFPTTDADERPSFAAVEIFHGHMGQPEYNTFGLTEILQPSAIHHHQLSIAQGTLELGKSIIIRQSLSSVPVILL